MWALLCGGRQGAGARGKGYRRQERKEQEVGVFRGGKAGDHIDKTFEIKCNK